MNIIANLTKWGKCDGTNYDIYIYMYQGNIQYLLNEEEVLESVTNIMEQPTKSKNMQHRCDDEAYQS